MARWKDDIASRLWRSEATLRATGVALYDAETLEAEVRAFKTCCDKLEAKGLMPNGAKGKDGGEHAG